MTFITLTFSLTSFAKSLELKKENRSIFIDEKSGWEIGKDLFGMPYIYFSPQLNSQRSNISFTDTGVETELDVKTLGSTQNVYQDGKKKWAESVKATIQSFSPYKVSVNKIGHKVHEIGMSYQHEEKSYVEKSYYVECRGRMLFAKSLRLQKNEVHEKTFQELISTIDCGGI